MKHVRTIGELTTKSRSALSAIFRIAMEASAVTALSVEERKAARRTVELLKRCLESEPGPQ